MKRIILREEVSEKPVAVAAPSDPVVIVNPYPRDRIVVIHPASDAPCTVRISYCFAPDLCPRREELDLQGGEPRRVTMRAEYVSLRVEPECRVAVVVLA